jgi:hypothetical protein
LRVRLVFFFVVVIAFLPVWLALAVLRASRSTSISTLAGRGESTRIHMFRAGGFTASAPPETGRRHETNRSLPAGRPPLPPVGSRWRSRRDDRLFGTRPPADVQAAIRVIRRQLPPYVAETNRALGEVSHPDSGRLTGLVSGQVRVGD